jgi:hypothetical protein
VAAHISTASEDNMTKLDPSITEAFRQDASAVVQVVITCDGDSAGIAAALRQIGVEVTGQIENFGIVNANLTCETATKADSIAGIATIELDEEASAL